MGRIKMMLRRKYIALKAYSRKEKRLKIHDLSINLKKLEKEQQSNLRK